MILLLTFLNKINTALSPIETRSIKGGALFYFVK